MSCHNLRKGLSVSVPDGLRKQLLDMSPANLPMAYLVRQSLLKALAEGLDWTTDVATGSSEPLQIPLSLEERMQLSERIAGRNVSEEVAALSLVDAALRHMRSGDQDEAI